MLPEDALRDEHQHQQAGGQRRLHHDQGRQQEGEHLERPAQHGEAGAEQPARLAHQPQGERYAEMLLARGRLGLGGLVGHP